MLKELGGWDILRGSWGGACAESSGWEDRVLGGTSVGQDLSPKGHHETQQINSCPTACCLLTYSRI